MNLKKLAAEKAVDYIENGMIVGLGTGSTALYAVEKLGFLVRERVLKITGIPTSKETESIAKKFHIPLSTLDEYSEIDVTIDGADEIDPKLNLIKGRGGALVREKIVASCTKKEIIVADSSKLVNVLGERARLPVEVAPFGWRAAERKIASEFNCKPELRREHSKIFVTDNGNYILDCKFEKIANPEKLEKEINSIPGVVDNGLFIGLADIALIAEENGTVKIINS